MLFSLLETINTASTIGHLAYAGGYTIMPTKDKGATRWSAQSIKLPIAQTNIMRIA